MIYEKFDYKAERAAYREDVAAQREADRIAAIESDRSNWAQRNGNDSLTLVAKANSKINQPTGLRPHL